ncbi:MAG TPA: calcium-binding protein [Ktedonobacteraceae bacterium]|nr:calcium-binding protein [Ktedonobacteraceae bacterium]
MARKSKDEERERRIAMEIIVDAYDEEEQAMGWWAYLDSNLHFPFTARCIAEMEISPLQPGEEVEVVGISSEGASLENIFALIKWQSRKLGVPLSQLEGVNVDDETRQAIEDWRYWVGQDEEEDEM